MSILVPTKPIFSSSDENCPHLPRRPADYRGMSGRSHSTGSKTHPWDINPERSLWKQANVHAVFIKTLNALARISWSLKPQGRAESSHCEGPKIHAAMDQEYHSLLTKVMQRHEAQVTKCLQLLSCRRLTPPHPLRTRPMYPGPCSEDVFCFFFF